MAAIETRGNKTGNFLKKEQWPEESWCRAEITVTRAGLSQTKSPGEIVYAATQAAGTYGFVPDGVLAAAGTGKAAIIVDSEYEEKIIAAVAAASATITVAALVNGDVILRKGGLEYNDSITFANLEPILAFQNMKLAAKFSVKAQS